MQDGRFRPAPDVALRILREHYNPRCDPPWSEEELQHKIEDAYRVETRRGFISELDSPEYLDRRSPKPSRNGQHGGHYEANGHHEAQTQPDTPQEDHRPVVEISTCRYEVLTATLAELHRDPDLYRRGDLLVTAVTVTEENIQLTASTILKYAAGTPKIAALSPALIGCHLTRCANFIKWSRDGHGEDHATETHPPQWLIEAVATVGQYPRVQPLLTVAECTTRARTGQSCSAPDTTDRPGPSSDFQ